MGFVGFACTLPPGSEHGQPVASDPKAPREPQVRPRGQAAGPADAADAADAAGPAEPSGGP